MQRRPNVIASGTRDRYGHPEGVGALVLSLDFELAWGVFDSRGSDGAYRSNLLGARQVIPRLLELFEQYGVAATWATVGFLFAESRDELEAFSPVIRPAYGDPRRDPYRVPVGEDERRDPVHYAPSLIRQIAETPRQEIGSHTFSHYYCLEPGQTEATFEADLEAAVAIAAVKGFKLRSLVLPRHQVRVDYLPVIARAGFDAHRTNEANGLNRPAATGREAAWVRAGRLLDAYVPLTGANAVAWSETAPDAHGLVDVRESRFVRPVNAHARVLEPFRISRIVGAMSWAARHGALCHLWWHPHNFGVHQDANLANLRSLLEAFARLREAHGFASFALAEIADFGVAASVAAPAPSVW